MLLVLLFLILSFTVFLALISMFMYCCEKVDLWVYEEAIDNPGWSNHKWFREFPRKKTPTNVPLEYSEHCEWVYNYNKNAKNNVSFLFFLYQFFPASSTVACISKLLKNINEFVIYAVFILLYVLSYLLVWLVHRTFFSFKCSRCSTYKSVYLHRRINNHLDTNADTKYNNDIINEHFSYLLSVEESMLHRIKIQDFFTRIFKVLIITLFALFVIISYVLSKI